jgi:hypothetical protein
MSSAKVQSTILQVTQLRTSANYHETMSDIHRYAPDRIRTMAGDKQSSDYAKVRLVIGTWERIAIVIRLLPPADRHRIFRCTPVSLMYKLLQPAIEQIRVSGADHDDTQTPEYAKELENLADEYDHWAQSPDGREFRTPAKQAICAMFG